MVESVTSITRSTQLHDTAAVSDHHRRHTIKIEKVAHRELGCVDIRMPSCGTMRLARVDALMARRLPSESRTSTATSSR